MRAGLLRQRITIQQPALVGGIQKWVTLADRVPADISPYEGSERATGLQPTTVDALNVVIRYQSGIKPKMRLLFGTRILEISSVLNVDERNRELDLICREVVN